MDSLELDLLEYYLQLGFIRPIDLQFARFLWSQALDINSEDEEGVVRANVLAKYGALVSHYLGKGHICVNLERISRGNPFQFDDKQLKKLSEQSTIEYSLEEYSSYKSIHYQDDTLSCNEPVTTPLVLDGSNLYLNRYWQYECRVAAYFKQAMPIDIDSVVMADVLNELFPMAATDDANIDYQKIAASIALINPVSVITGGPGTGKTYTVVRLLAAIIKYYEMNAALGSADKLPIIKLAAPTGKAAARMLESIRASIDSLPLTDKQFSAFPHDANTLHRLLGSLPKSSNFKHNKDNPLHLDILVVDEASMIDLPMMAKLLSAMPLHGKVIFLGDKDQLASVEAGAVLNDLCQENTGYSVQRSHLIKQLTGYDVPSTDVADENGIQDCLAWLKTSRRFGADSGIGNLARYINQGDVKSSLEVIVDPSFQDVNAKVLSEKAYKQCLDEVAKGYIPFINLAHKKDYKTALLEFTHQRLLCALREGLFGVSELNHQIEHRLNQFRSISKSGEWYVGRPVMVTQNDHALQLYNGDIGIVMEDEEGKLRVFFESSSDVRSVLPSRMPTHETAFAMTVHKSQGSEFDHTYLILPDKMNPVVTRELVYTGVTRAKSRLSLLYRKNVIEDAIETRVERFSGLIDRLA